MTTPLYARDVILCHVLQSWPHLIATLSLSPEGGLKVAVSNPLGPGAPLASIDPSINPAGLTVDPIGKVLDPKAKVW